MPATAMSARMRVRTVPPVRDSARDDERKDESEERERLGEGDAEEHRGSHGARRLRLTRHGRNRVTDHQTDADAGTDRGASVNDASTDSGESLGGISRGGGEEQVQHDHRGLLTRCYQ